MKETEMNFLELTAIDTQIEARYLSDNNTSGRELDLEDDYDDLERPATVARATNVVPLAPLPTADEAPAGMYSVVSVFVNDVREFYPRKDGKVGTRIVYCNGAARIVKELYTEVKTGFAAP
jgi:hypothetical protein